MEEAKENTEEPGGNEWRPRQSEHDGPTMPDVTGEQQAAVASPPAESGSRELVVPPTNNSSNGTGGAAPAGGAGTAREEQKEEPSGVMHTTQADLYFLIANFLTHASPCSQAAQVLKREMEENNLLGVTYNWQNQPRPASYDDVRARYPHLPANHLSRITAEYLRQVYLLDHGTMWRPGFVDVVSVFGGFQPGATGASRQRLGPAGDQSLLRRVEPVGMQRVAVSKRRTECRREVVSACLKLVEIHGREKRLRSKHFDIRRRLNDAIEQESKYKEESEKAVQDVLVTRGFAKERENAGQEKQLELTRLGLEKEAQSLAAERDAIPEAIARAKRHKDFCWRQARNDRFVTNSLSRYDFQARGVCTHHVLANRRAGGVLFGGGRRTGPTPLRRMEVKMVAEKTRELVTVNGHGINPVYCIKYDQTGQYIFTGADDRLVKVWSAITGRLLLTLRGHSSEITDLAVSPDNSLLVSSSEDRNLRVWDPRTGASLAVLRGHSQMIHLVRFAPAESILVSASEDGTCRVWDLRNRASLASEEIIPIVLPHTNEQGVCVPVKCLSVSQAGNLIAAGCNDGAVTLWSYWDNDEPTPSGHNTRRGKPRDGEVFRRQRPSADDRSPSLAQAPAAPWSPVAQAAAAEGAVNMAPFGAGIPDFGMADSGGGAAFGPSGVVGAGESAGATGMFPGSAAGATAGAGGSGAAGAASAGNGEGARRGGGSTRGRGRVGGRAEEEWDAGPLEVRRVLKLMGHVSGVTDTRFSNLGDRILTASMDDGTARVFFWGPKFTFANHKVFKVCRQDAFPTAAGRGRGSARRSSAKSKTTLDDACWSCDDRLIITAECPSNERNVEGVVGSHIKIWDSWTSHFLFSINRAHSMSVSALIPHPFDPGCLASAGNDGSVTTWEIGPNDQNKASKRMTFKNILNDGPQSEHHLHTMPVGVLDAVYSPDGASLAVTDYMGRWKIYGTGLTKDETSAGRKVPLEQYFVSDYRELIRDERDNVLDAFTQLPPHLAQTGDLTDLNGNAYPEEYQPDRLGLKGPPPLPPEAVAQRAHAVKALAAELHKTLVAFESTARANANRNRGSTSSSGGGVGGSVGGSGSGPKWGASAAGRGGVIDLSNGERRDQERERGGATGAGASGGGVGRRTTREESPFGLYADLDSDDSGFGSSPRAAAGAGGGGRRSTRRSAGRGTGAGNRLGDGSEIGAVATNGHGGMSREERARRREQGIAAASSAPGGRTVGGGSRRGGGGGAAAGGTLSSGDDVDDDEWDDDDDDSDAEEAGRISRRGGGRGRGRGKGKGRKRSRRPRRENGVSEGVNGFVPIQLVADQFGPLMVVVDSDDEEEEEQPSVAVAAVDGVSGGEGPGGRPRRQNRGRRPPAEAAAEQIRKVKRESLRCALCREGHSAAHPLPGPTVHSGGSPVMEGNRALWVHDGCAMYSPKVARDEATGVWCNIALEVKRGRSLHCSACNGKGATIGCLEVDCKKSYHFKCAEKTGWSFVNAVDKFHCKKCRKRRGINGCVEEETGGGGAGAEVESAPDREEEEEPSVANDVWVGRIPAVREWLTMDNPSDATVGGYCPQVGEVVMYFPQGHATYLRTFPENQTPPYKLFKGRPAVVRCQVKELSYAFPSDHEESGCYSVVCRLTLQVLGFPYRVSDAVVARTAKAQAAQGEYPLAFRADSFRPPAEGDQSTTFSVSVRDSGAADFLVPEKRYDEAVNIDWKPAQRVMMEWREEEDGTGGGGLTPFYGVVTKVARDQSSGEVWPNSPWDCIVIKWDSDGDSSASGPWEPRQVTWAEGEPTPQLDTTKLRAHIPSNLRDSLVVAVQAAIDSDESADFRMPVPEAFHDYPNFVPVPMDLGLVLRRLQNDYYCCVEALEHDCKLIRTNCAQYNEKGSEIIKMAGRVVKRLLSAIRSRVSSTRSASAASAAAAAGGAGSGSAWGGGGGSSGASGGGAGADGADGDYVEAEDAMDTVSHGGYLVGNGGGGTSGGGGSGGGRTSGGGSSSAGFGGGGSGGRESGRTNKPPKKRGRGRPRKYPKAQSAYQEEVEDGDDDEPFGSGPKRKGKKRAQPEGGRGRGRGSGAGSTNGVSPRTGRARRSSSAGSARSEGSIADNTSTTGARASKRRRTPTGYSQDWDVSQEEEPEEEEEEEEEREEVEQAEEEGQGGEEEEGGVGNYQEGMLNMDQDEQEEDYREIYDEHENGYGDQQYGSSIEHRGNGHHQEEEEEEEEEGEHGYQQYGRSDEHRGNGHHQEEEEEEEGEQGEEEEGEEEEEEEEEEQEDEEEEEGDNEGEEGGYGYSNGDHQGMFNGNDGGDGGGYDYDPSSGASSGGGSYSGGAGAGAGAGGGFMSNDDRGDGGAGSTGSYSNHGGVRESAASAAQRALSPVVLDMLKYQEDLLDSHGAREIVLWLAQQVWQEPPPPIEVNMAEVTDYMLSLLSAADEHAVFAEPVSEEAAPGYMAAIRWPMDFGTISERARNQNWYRSVNALQDDLVLVFGNCLTYNEPDTPFAHLAITMTKQAHHAWAEALAAVSRAKGWVRGGMGAAGWDGGGGAGAGGVSPPPFPGGRGGGKGKKRARSPTV